MKISDIVAVLHRPTQQTPLFIHTEVERNRRVNTIRADILKYRDRLCEACNTRLTQPYDRAWQRISEWIRVRVCDLPAGARIRGSRIFRVDARRRMREMHLYFVKQFGCCVMEARSDGHDLGIDLAPLAHALRTGAIYPNLYLRIGRHPVPLRSVGFTDLHLKHRLIDRKLARAVWLYWLDGWNVIVAFGDPRVDDTRRPLGWNPRCGSTSILVEEHTSAGLARPK